MTVALVRNGEMGSPKKDGKINVSVDELVK